MKLNYALLCDLAFISMDRKVSIINVFETISAVEFPVTHPKFTLTGSIRTEGKKKFSIGVDIVDVRSGASILEKVQLRDVNLPENSSAKDFNFIIDILNTDFPVLAMYGVQVKIDGEVITELPLTLAKTEVDN